MEEVGDLSEEISIQPVRVFIVQVPKQITEEQLLALLREVATVDEVYINHEIVAETYRGCYFMCPSKEEADKAITALHNKKTLPGATRPLEVKYADGELERLEHKPTFALPTSSSYSGQRKPVYCPIPKRGRIKTRIKEDIVKSINHAFRTEHKELSISQPGSSNITNSDLSMVLRKIESCIPPKELGFPFPSVHRALKKLEGYMKEIEKILLLLQSFIATSQQSHSVSFKDWLDKTREVGKTVEDLIREYASLAGKTEELINNDNSNNRCDTQSWIKLSKKFKEITFELQYRLDLQANFPLVREEESSKGEKDFDGSLRTEGASSSQSPSLNEGEMIGREEERSLLMNWLTEQHSERAIISICGIGGVGKTTLARNIYEDNAIRSSFDCFLWVNASQNYQVEDLLKTILAQLVGSYQCAQGASDVTNNKSLAEKIRSYLKNQRYLIVLNDMWDSAPWLSLHRAFPALDCQTPNRVVITTRVEDVALVAGKDRAIRLETLTEEQAQDLLFRKAFSNREIFNNWVQNPVLERILRKCQGLPLIIVAVGSILAQKDETEWKSFSDQFTMHLNDDPTMRGVVDILNRSVTNLPSHLKNCFLHCSLFPESFYIIRKEITKMWVAEGFIKEGETDKTMDELADQYLLELVNHSLLQVAEERWDGQPKKLVMNSFVREVALNTSGKVKFGTILGDSYAYKLDYGTRRLSIHNCRGNQIPTKVSQKLRSFLLFPSDIPYSFTNDVLSSCMLLRVLCLKYAKIQVLPDCVSKLFNLCYLNLRYSGIKQIPQSFGDLHNLEMLDLRCEEPVSLSRGSLAMLHKLRHLYVREGNREDCYSLSDACALESLQTLKTVVLTEDMASGLGNLIELRSLTVAAVAGSNAWDILDSLMQLSHLISLKIFNRSGACVKLAKCKAFPNLEKIHLVGPVDVASTGIQSDSLQKLKVLKMKKSRIQTDPLPHISLFPDLVVLCLQDAYQGPNLTFKENWLPKLKSLTLSGMDKVVSIYIEAGTMRNVNFLRICQLKRLKEVPKGIMYLESLHELFIEDVPQFYSVQEEGVRVLIDMVKFGSPRQKEMATIILLQICEKNEAYKTMFVREGIILMRHQVVPSKLSSSQLEKLPLTKGKKKTKIKKGTTSVQGLYDVCKKVFAECGPGIVPGQEDVVCLSSYLEKIKLEDVGLKPSWPYFFWHDNNSKESHPPVTYLHIYQCSKFSIGIFCMPQSAVIPLHNHPGMTAFSKILFGSMHIRSYDWVTPHHVFDQTLIQPEGERLAKVTTDAVFEAPCENSILYPEIGGNIHCFTAVTSCAVLDVLCPPYSEEEGRDCTYYDAYPFSTLSGGMSVPSEDGEYVWLRARNEIPLHFKLDVGEYEGPKITEK